MMAARGQAENYVRGLADDNEGLPMPQEPAYAAERRQGAEAKAAYERAKDRMSVASLWRRGMGNPEPSRQDVDPRPKTEPLPYVR
jgi:hypothetical protein